MPHHSRRKARRTHGASLALHCLSQPESMLAHQPSHPPGATGPLSPQVGLSVACSKCIPQPSQEQGPTALRREGPGGVRKDSKTQTNPISNLTTK